MSAKWWSKFTFCRWRSFYKQTEWYLHVFAHTAQCKDRWDKSGRTARLDGPARRRRPDNELNQWMLVESILGEYAGAGSMELWVKGGLGLGKVRGGPKKEMYIYIYIFILFWTSLGSSSIQLITLFLQKKGYFFSGAQCTPFSDTPISSSFRFIDLRILVGDWRSLRGVAAKPAVR